MHVTPPIDMFTSPEHVSMGFICIQKADGMWYYRRFITVSYGVAAAQAVDQVIC